MKPALPLWILVLASLTLATAAVGLAALPTLSEGPEPRGSDLEPAVTVEPEDNLALSLDTARLP